MTFGLLGDAAWRGRLKALREAIDDAGRISASDRMH